MTHAMQEHRGIVAGKASQAIASSWDVDGTQATCNGITCIETVNMRDSGSITRVAQN